MTEPDLLADGRNRHLIVRALALSLAAMEATSRTMRAESDMADWDRLLAEIAPNDLERDMANQSAWNVIANIGRKD